MRAGQLRPCARTTRGAENCSALPGEPRPYDVHRGRDRAVSSRAPQTANSRRAMLAVADVPDLHACRCGSRVPSKGTTRTAHVLDAVQDPGNTGALAAHRVRHWVWRRSSRFPVPSDFWNPKAVRADRLDRPVSHASGAAASLDETGAHSLSEHRRGAVGNRRCRRSRSCTRSHAARRVSPSPWATRAPGLARKLRSLVARDHGGAARCRPRCRIAERRPLLPASRCLRFSPTPAQSCHVCVSIAFFVFFIGACVGSFLNVCASPAGPLELSVVRPRSRCPKLWQHQSPGTTMCPC